MNHENVYELKNIDFIYQQRRLQQQALCDISLTIKTGSFLGLTGPSGSGKTTLLNVLGFIEHPNSGEILFNGASTRTLSESEYNRIRLFDLGFIFQNFNLFPTMTVYENVEYFVRRQGIKGSDSKQRVIESLESVGLIDHIKKRPMELSGGQRQRVSIARALAKKPKVILADEPTASLDQKTGKQILEILQKLNVEKQITILLCSHDTQVLSVLTQTLRLVDGKITQGSLT